MTNRIPGQLSMPVSTLLKLVVVYLLVTMTKKLLAPREIVNIRLLMLVLPLAKDTGFFELMGIIEMMNMPA